jgi:hypothetical protein
MMKGSIHQENITVLNVRAPNKRISTIRMNFDDSIEKRNRQL